LEFKKVILYISKVYRLIELVAIPISRSHEHSLESYYGRNEEVKHAKGGAV
jgi:hypothetical protein